jgi:hypothetical protein
MNHVVAGPETLVSQQFVGAVGLKSTDSIAQVVLAYEVGRGCTKFRDIEVDVGVGLKIDSRESYETSYNILMISNSLTGSDQE